jgi:signal peptidase I
MHYKMKKNLSIFLKGWGFSLAVAILISTSFKSSLADWNDIPSGSMEPTIMIGDRVFVNKLAYDLKLPYTTVHLAQWANPKRGDIVVFYSPQDGTRLIKRVVGLPGDTLAMWQNKLIMNGQSINYDPLPEGNQRESSVLLKENLEGKNHVVKLLPTLPSFHSFSPLTVPEGQYFMMGDNRDNSADSRFFGFVERNLIVGQATMVALSRDGSFLHPRWSRFLKELL